MGRPTNLLYKIYEDRLLGSLDASLFPRHIGIILDGHRRYARSERLPSFTDSYRAGMRKFEEFLGWADQLEIPAITGWVLSRENLDRPDEELHPYFEVLVELFERIPSLCATQSRSLRFIGSMDLLPDSVVEAAESAARTAGEGDKKLTIAMGYGGRQEIVDAARELVADLVERGIETGKLADAIDAESLAAHMYLADVPDPDLLIRTSGESRLSGFLLWQSAYSEFAFVDVYWPAFRRVDFLRSLRDFTRRERRFGR